MKNRKHGARKLILGILTMGIFVVCVFLCKDYIIKQEESIKEPIKVACIGDSLTFRRDYEGEEVHNYSEYLSDLLGNEYEVKNFGEAGACVRVNGDYPYKSLRVYKESIEFNADLLVIMIGTNDVWDYNWINEKEFKRQYIELIDSYLGKDRNPKIYLCTLPKIYDGTGNSVEGVCGERIEILSNIIREVAIERGYTLIEMNTFTAEHQDWYCKDNLHFSNYGAKKIASEIANVLINNLKQKYE